MIEMAVLHNFLHLCETRLNELQIEIRNNIDNSDIVKVKMKEFIQLNMVIKNVKKYEELIH